MIVAGSVLALLLMGLAVDGFVNPADEEGDDPTSDTGGEGDPSDQSGEGNALTDLLYAEDDPTDAVEPQDEGQSLSLTEEEETGADTAWIDVAAAAFRDVDAVTTVESGEDVAYVEDFDPATDTLVLEFEGTEADTPEITVEHDPREDAAIVFANGLPVTLVEGAEGMGPENVRVIMEGVGERDATDPEPQVLPDAEGLAAVERGGDPSAPLVQVPQAEGEEEAEPRTEPAEVAPTSPMPTPPIGAQDPGTAAPLTPPGSETAEVAPRDPGTDGPLTQVTSLPPPPPDDGALDTLFDHVVGELTSSGGLDEMLNARADIDDAFGTGGEDALTGSSNDEMITGGDGQDAMFGNEGDDTLMAGAGNDELHGGDGNDDLQGDAGLDFLDGGAGQDTLDGGGDRDLLFGGDGDDVLYGGAAHDFLQGGMGADMLNGGSGNDTLDGVYGDGSTDKDDADVLWAGDGDDNLIIGQGDTAHGGAGADTFTTGSYIETAEVAGHVTDFNPSEDRIEVIFDPQENPNPTLEVLDFVDGSGADIILNGEVILSVAGAQGLDPNLIDLRAMA